jgi:transposase InsO family protein
MPWKTISLAKLRQQLIEQALAGRKPLKALCEDFDVSRQTAYKWLRRFHKQGRRGLRDQSRRPRHSPQRLAPKWVQLIGQWRRRRPHWGAKKIRWQLRRSFPKQRLPCIRSIQRWLKRLGWIQARQRRARRGPVVPFAGLTQAKSPNAVWTIDFKGWFRTADGVRQEPLTIRDMFSRYGLGLRLLPNQDDRPVRKAMQLLFRRCGLPKIIRVDNGSPFSGTGALGLSRLSVWWLRLGIRVEFTRRARPGDNARHEQFHGCYQREVVATGAVDRRSMQNRSTRWLAAYNHNRPHEALKQKTPAQVYRPSQRSCPKDLPVLKYPHHWKTRRVRNRGHIKWLGRLRFIGRAFVGQTIAIKSLENHLHGVHLGKLLIGHLHDLDPGGMRPARWQRQNNIIKV